MMKFKFAAKEVMVEMAESIKTMCITGVKKVRSFFTKQRIFNAIRALKIEVIHMLRTLIAPIPKITMWVMRILLVAIIPCLVVKSISAMSGLVIAGFIATAIIHLLFTFAIRVFDKMTESSEIEKNNTDMAKAN